MNYITETNAFYDWLLYNPLPTGAIALWHALMSINNKASWADEFTVANLVLQGMTGLSRQGLDKARNLLIQKGLMQYKKGTSNQAGRYKMISLERIKVGTVVGTKADKENLECKKIGTAVVTVGAQQEAQQGRSSSTLNKLNETKQDDVVDVPPSPPNRVSAVELFHKNNMGSINPIIADVLDDIELNNSPELIEEAFKIAAANNASSIRYVEKILIAWKNKGIISLKQLEEHKNRKEADGSAKSKKAKDGSRGNGSQGDDQYSGIGISL